MSPEWMKQMEKILIRDEGLRFVPYKDSRDNWTIGVGRYIGGRLDKMRISEAVAVQMLREDIEEAVKGCIQLFGQDAFLSWPAARQQAVVSLVFNLGYRKLKDEFLQTVPAISRGYWTTAAENLRTTLWAQQVKSRAMRITHMLEHNEIPEEYDT